MAEIFEAKTRDDRYNPMDGAQFYQLSL